MNGLRASDMDSQEIRSSEAFLKTFKEPKNWKNWGITVAKILRDYMVLIDQMEGNMDFAEAAVVVQNSTFFYSKRVDEVFKTVGNLLTSISHVNEDDKTVEGHPKRRKVAKPLEATDLQLLDFVASDNNININPDKLKKRQNQDVIHLNTNINPPRKPGTYCPIYQSDGQEICSKDKFRSLGYISSNGIVDDFTFSNGELNRVADLNQTFEADDCDIDSFRDQISFGGEPMEIASPLRNQEPSLALFPPPPLEPVASPLADVISGIENSPQPSNQFPLEIDLNNVNLQPVVRLKKVVDWEEVPFNFKFPSKKILKVKSVFTLPPEILTINNRRGKKRKKEKNNNDVSQADWLERALKKGANPVSSPLEHMMLVEAKKKRALLAEEAKRKQRAADPAQVNDQVLEAPPDDDLDDNGRDDFIFDGPDEPAALAGPSGCGASLLIPDADQVAEQEAQNSRYSTDIAQSLIKNFRDRKEMAFKAAEVAKKVAIWQESILPKLKIAESRTKFDVKEYSQRILDKFPVNDDGQFRPFENFVRGQPKHEIGRYFLSTLVMANTYNVEIRKSSPIPLAVDRLELKLLSKTRRLSRNFGAGEEF